MPENFRRPKIQQGGGNETKVAPVPSQSLDLTNLTEQEEKIIQNVIQKDELERSIVEAKISEIRKEIQELRKAGALTSGDDQDTICARCKYKFPSFVFPLGDHGQRCTTCKFRVCKKCSTREPSGMWLCVLCLKYRQEKWLTGEWLSKGQSFGLQGSDLLRVSLRNRSRSLRNKHLSNNCHSEHTLYYDDVKAMNPRLSRLNNEDSLSVSSLCSDYSQNPKYRSLRKSSNTSELELFRKKGERYSLRRKKAYSTEDPPTGSLISDQGSETVNKSKTEKPVKSSIPHWHETLKKQKAVLATARQLRSQKSLVASKTPEVNVVVNSENDMFPLVKPKIAKTNEAENTGQYLSPNLSKEDYSSSMESISMYVKAAQVSKPNTEGNITTNLQSSTNSFSQSVSISKAATVMTSTPKAKKNATQLSLDIPTLKLTCPVEDDTITADIFKTERKVGFYRSVSVGTSNQHFKKTGLTLTFLKRGWSRSKELVRDNESIASSSHITSSQVTSSHVTSPTSRTSTPEPQRPQHQARPASDQQLAVPTIAVSNSTNEREPAEDDDLDDLFSKHRPQLLGSRSSLAVSLDMGLMLLPPYYFFLFDTVIEKLFSVTDI
uniref:RabBD domain-containing protein n=1 Tax=Biomphalaria glabrata TaxID=6526 RepID=A0A2C9LH64_BIOGL